MTNDLLTNAVLQTVSVQVPYKGTPYSMNAAPVSDGQKIILVAPPSLVAYLPGKTTPEWTASGAYAGMPAVANGVVYAISGGQLRANDAATGSILWTFAADSELTFPPVVAGRFVYAASSNNVYAFDTTAEQMVWSTTPGDGSPSPAGRCTSRRRTARSPPTRSRRGRLEGARGEMAARRLLAGVVAACGSGPSGTTGTGGSAANGGQAGMATAGASGKGGAAGGSHGGAGGSSAGPGGQGGLPAAAARLAPRARAEAPPERAARPAAARPVERAEAPERVPAVAAPDSGGHGAAGGADGTGGLGGVGGGVGGAAARPCVGVCGTTLTLQPSHMVYDSSRDRLYVTIQGGAPLYPRQVTAIYPRAPAVTAFDPHRLGPERAGAVERRLDVVGGDGRILLDVQGDADRSDAGRGPAASADRPTSNGIYTASVYVQAMLPMSDSPDTVAALASGGPNTLAVYDDGVPRANPNKVTSYPTFIFNGPPGSSDGAVDGGLGHAALDARAVDRDRASDLPELSAAGQGAGTLHKANRLYASGNGRVPRDTPSTPTPVGTLSVSGTALRPHGLTVSGCSRRRTRRV